MYRPCTFGSLASAHTTKAVTVMGGVQQAPYCSHQQDIAVSFVNMYLQPMLVQLLVSFVNLIRDTSDNRVSQELAALL